MSLVKRIIQPIVTKTGSIAANGGAVNVDIAIPANGLSRLTADVLLLGLTAGAVDKCAGLPAEIVVKNVAGAVTAVTASVGSTNPKNSNTAGVLAARAVADELVSGGGADSTAVWSISGANARLTITNNGTEACEYDVAIYAHHVVFSFTPGDLAGLAAWYRADLGITLASITTVGQWNDQSASADPNKNLVQAVAANRPAYVPNDAAYNGKPTIQFVAAASQFLQSAIWGVPLAQPYSMFIIGQADILAPYYWADGGVVNEGAFISSAGSYQVFAGAGPLGVANALPNTPIFFGATFNGAASKIFIQAQTPTVGAAGASGKTGLFVGGAANATSFLNGKIAEIIVLNHAASAAEISLLAAYVTARYGIVIAP